MAGGSSSLALSTACFSLADRLGCPGMAPFDAVNLQSFFRPFCSDRAWLFSRKRLIKKRDEGSKIRAVVRCDTRVVNPQAKWLSTALINVHTAGGRALSCERRVATNLTAKTQAAEIGCDN